MAIFATTTLLSLLGLWTAASTSTIHTRQSTQCTEDFFTSIATEGLVIERVQHVTGGFFSEAGNMGYPVFPTGLPPLCAVIVGNTSSNYRFGMFLPDEWNSRFLAIGSYSFLGGINWLETGVGVKYGMATLSTDTGHNSGQADITWANTTEKKVNWAYQALEGSITAGKALIQSYYNNQNIAYSYFSGCSTGGREGLKQIQRNPAMFDGALIGAPAWDTKHLMPLVSELAVWNLPENASHSINDTALFTRLQQEVVKQCDELDGVKDHIVSAPSACRERFDITQVRCDVVANKTACWTQAQIDTANKIYSDYVTADGEFVYKGAEYGSELTWPTFLFPAEPDNLEANVRRNFDAQYEQYFMSYGPGWPITAYNDSTVADAEARDEGEVHATADQYDLGAFRARGKIVMYGGLADHVVPVRQTTLYYERTAEAMGGGGGGGASEIDDFFRYFQIPGMGHCWGSADNVRAPWMMGGEGQAVQLPPYTAAASVPLGFNDSRHDALLALVAWVEQGVPVDQIIASEFNVTGGDAAQDLVLYRQRPLCVYPQTAKWDGMGNQDEAASWTCSR
ncbi:tannase and feruloyl esterase [Xylariomycetidae sp. FL0641]|nr:tannase and feruloyl esterase [Xylariomycetidae sp. FL0641]